MTTENQAPEGGQATSECPVCSALVVGVAKPKAEDINAQKWAGMDGATAFHLIQRHGEDWSHVGRLMEAWRIANTAAAQSPAEGDELRSTISRIVSSYVDSPMLVDELCHTLAKPQPKGMPDFGKLAAHWLKLGDQDEREGRPEVADAWRVCADQLMQEAATQAPAPARTAAQMEAEPRTLAEAIAKIGELQTEVDAYMAALRAVPDAASQAPAPAPDHVPVSAEHEAETDAKLGLKLLPPIRVDLATFEALDMAAFTSGKIIQAVVRERLEAPAVGDAE